LLDASEGKYPALIADVNLGRDKMSTPDQAYFTPLPIRLAA
jgi:hypothetical protein